MKRYPNTRSRWIALSTILTVAAGTGLALCLLGPWRASETLESKVAPFAKTRPLRIFLKTIPALGEKWRSEVAWELAFGKQNEVSAKQLHSLLPAFTENLRERGMLASPEGFQDQFQRRHKFALTAVETDNGSGPPSTYETEYLSPRNRRFSYSPQSEYFRQKDLSGLNMRPVLRSSFALFGDVIWKKVGLWILLWHTGE
ncbi:MAG: hypothetical protein ACFCD0_13210 [Gemmataceae bacterium]